MKKVSILFKSVIDMLDFESVIAGRTHESDHARLTIFGDFEEADLELAKAGYGAEIIEEDLLQK